MIIKINKPEPKIKTEIVSLGRGCGKSTQLAKRVIEFTQKKNETETPAILLVACMSKKAAELLQMKIVAEALSKNVALKFSTFKSFKLVGNSDSDPLVKVHMTYPQGQVHGFNASALFMDDYECFSEEYKAALIPLISLRGELVFITQTV